MFGQIAARGIALSLVVAFGILFAGPPVGIAQPHATGLMFVGGGGNNVAVGLVQNAGPVVTLLRSSVLGAVRLGRGTMDVDNEGFVATYAVGNAIGLMRIDRMSRLTTVLIGSGIFSAVPPQDVAISPDGGYDVLSAGVTLVSPALYTVDRFGRVTTVYQSTLLVRPQSFLRDTETGDFLVADHGGVFLQSGRIFRIPPDGSSLTSVASYPTLFSAPVIELAQDGLTGDLYLATGGSFMRITLAGAATQVFPSGPFAFVSCLAADRRSAGRPRLIGGFGPGAQRQSLFAYDIGSQTVTTLVQNAALGDLTSVFPYRGRNVTTVRRGIRQWEIALSFPTEPNKQYACVLGISGTRPGFVLGPRRVALNPDAVTGLTAGGALGRIFTGGAGTLDATGRGMARLNLNAFPNLGGLRIHAIAIVVDPAAPLGVSIIADPALMIV